MQSKNLVADAKRFEPADGMTIVSLVSTVAVRSAPKAYVGASGVATLQEHATRLVELGPGRHREGQSIGIARDDAEEGRDGDGILEGARGDAGVKHRSRVRGRHVGRLQRQLFQKAGVALRPNVSCAVR